MKNPEKQLFEAFKMMKANSYLAIRDGSLTRVANGSLLYHQAEKMSIEAQEEIGRKNKTSMLKEMAKAGITKGSFEERKKQFKEKKIYENQNT